MGISNSTNRNPLHPQPVLGIRHIQDLQQFQKFEPGIRALLEIYQSVLLDDFCDPNLDYLVSNSSTYLPWFWLLTDEQNTVYAMASLSHIIPGRHAYLHGVSHPKIRRNPALSQLGNWVVNVAFQSLGVHKVKAEIEGNNLGAKGFCRRMGFKKEAHFRQDNSIGGQWQDVLVYALFAKQFKPQFNEILR